MRSAFALAVIAAVALLSTTASANAAPASPPTTTDPAVAAAGWLAQQFENAAGKSSPAGDHFTFPGGTYYWGGLTASGVFALAAAKVGGNKLGDALAYMKANAASDAGLGSGMSPGPFDGSVATYALAAIVADTSPTSFGGTNLLQALKDDECTTVSAPAGTTDYTTPLCPVVGAARNIYSSVSESLTILAESRGASIDAKYAPSSAAVDYFLSLQCPNGGFTGSTEACTSNADASVDETGYAAQALQALGGHAAELKRATDWLLSTRDARGYWVVQGGPDVDSTGLAAAALDGAGVDVSTSRAWLATQQVTTGPTIGAGASRGALRYQGKFDASSSIKATADGLLGLAKGGSLATLTAAGSAPDAPVLALAEPTVGTSSVKAGGTQTITASGFTAGETVAAVLHSTPIALGTTKATKTGTISYTFLVPATLPAGTHTVVLSGSSSRLTVTSVPFTVAAAAAVTTPTPSSAGATPAGATPTLADTGLAGAAVLEQALLGLGLLLAGAGAVYAGRTRRA